MKNFNYVALNDIYVVGVKSNKRKDESLSQNIKGFKRFYEENFSFPNGVKIVNWEENC